MFKNISVFVATIFVFGIMAGDSLSMNVQLIFSDADLNFTGTVNVSVKTNPVPISVNYYVDNILFATKTVQPFTWAWDTTSVVDGSHTIKAVGIYKNNRTTQDSKFVTVVNAVSPPVDTTPPSVPGSFAKTSSTTTSISTSWVASTDAVGVKGYNIYRNGFFDTQLPDTATIYVFKDLICGTSYSLSIEAFDAAGNKSAKSTITAATSVCDPAPDLSTIYLSDLTPVSAINGWGPYEKDKSNGEDDAGDGQTLTIGGATFAKGLGVHAFSELRYARSDSTFNRFRATIGLDDEVGANGTVVFQVFDGATKIYDSGIMNGSTAAKIVDVGISGINELRLVVTDAGDNFIYDHADWGSARLEKVAVTSPPSSPPSGSIIFQDDFETDFPSSSGLNPNAAPPSSPSPSGTPACYNFNPQGTWVLNISSGGTIANVVPPSPGRNARAMKYDLPATLAGNHNAFGQRGHTRFIGERYYGIMLYLPSTWREPAGAADDTNNINDTWGAVLMQLMYPPFISGGGNVALMLHADSIKMSVQAGDGVFGTAHASGSNHYTRYGNGGGYLNLNGNLGTASQWMVIPQGQMTKQVWHEIIVGINWTFGPENGDPNAFWKSWWRRKGESTWNQTVNFTGAYPSQWWGTAENGCVLTAQQVRNVATYSLVGPYRAKSNFPLTYWVDNYIEGTTFDVVAATMP